ncbi:MAG TPA: glycosyltransferase family 4 protein [Candidatus Cloacimonadota bacterium]|nr:glycosyltransferase family 4 protein [Candidatus Cloacimonadota bacterium]
MKILFVCSGNSSFFEVSPFIKSQANSLIAVGHKVDLFPIKGKGLQGYLKNIKKLRSHLRCNNYDIIHAHYSLCGIVTRLATNKPIVVSLMGSDVHCNWFMRMIISLFVLRFWSATIVKSEEMKTTLKISNLYVIPNGINLSVFKPMDQNQCRQELSLLPDKKYILFAADPTRKVKNFPLAQAAFALINDQNVELITLGGIDHDKIPLYLNAADVLISTSIWEGSPNVIKEAMACNCPIVSTDVGDVRWLFDNLEGCFLASFEPNDFVAKIKLSLTLSKRTKGRDRIIELELDSDSVAHKLAGIYEQVINGNK